VLVTECSTRCLVYPVIRGAPTVPLPAVSGTSCRLNGSGCAGFAGMEPPSGLDRNPVDHKVPVGRGNGLKVLSLGRHHGPARGISAVLSGAVPVIGFPVHCAAAPVVASSGCRCLAKNPSITGSREQEGGRDHAGCNQTKKRLQAFRSIA
jgi:hypothetical protein